MDTRNFTPRALRALARAKKQAGNLGFNFVGTEHVLLAICEMDEPMSCPVLRNMGVTSSNVLAKIRKLVRRKPEGGADTPSWGILSAKVIGAFNLAEQERAALSHSSVGTEHLLLGILKQANCGAVAILNKLGVNINTTIKEVFEFLKPNLFPTGENGQKLLVDFIPNCQEQLEAALEKERVGFWDGNAFVRLKNIDGWTIDVLGVPVYFTRKMLACLIVLSKNVTVQNKEQALIHLLKMAK